MNLGASSTEDIMDFDETPITPKRATELVLSHTYLPSLI